MLIFFIHSKFYKIRELSRKILKNIGVFINLISDSQKINLESALVTDQSASPCPPIQ